MVFYVVLSACGLLGLSLCLYILLSKHEKKPLVCPLEGSCDEIIHSKHSQPLGIPVEIIGIGYYTLILISYGIFALLHAAPAPLALITLTFISTCALLFSVYLVSIQAFIIKHWCSWCLISAGLSTFICIISFITLSDETLLFVIEKM